MLTKLFVGILSLKVKMINKSQKLLSLTFIGQARPRTDLQWNKEVLIVVFANKAGSKMSGEVYLLWLLSLLQTVSLLTVRNGSAGRCHSCLQ